MKVKDEKKLITKLKWFLYLLGKIKVPMIGYTSPKLLELTGTTVRIKIKLRWRTRNHLNSMYFGALAVGADVTGGIHAFYFAKKMNKEVSFAFKGMQANFIKRAETDIVFSTNEGELIEEALVRSMETGDRINQPIKVVATNTEGEIVAEFTMISSMRCEL
tara:strand:- start:166 stop:648 length:483 start_codon:yes stop_codon:yes gene_type:complete